MDWQNLNTFKFYSNLPNKLNAKKLNKIKFFFILITLNHKGNINRITLRILRLKHLKYCLIERIRNSNKSYNRNRRKCDVAFIKT